MQVTYPSGHPISGLRGLQNKENPVDISTNPVKRTTASAAVLHSMVDLERI